MCPFRFAYDVPAECSIVIGARPTVSPSFPDDYYGRMAGLACIGHIVPDIPTNLWNCLVILLQGVADRVGVCVFGVSLRWLVALLGLTGGFGGYSMIGG